MILKSTRLKGRSRTVTPAVEPAPAPSTPFEPRSETVEQVAHTLSWVGNAAPDIIARAAVSAALRVNATSPESRRVPRNQELAVALEALLDMPTQKSPRHSTQPERPWQQDHEGAAAAMLTALHELKGGGVPNGVSD